MARRFAAGRDRRGTRRAVAGACGSRPRYCATPVSRARRHGRLLDLRARLSRLADADGARARQPGDHDRARYGCRFCWWSRRIVVGVLLWGARALSRLIIGGVSSMSPAEPLGPAADGNLIKIVLISMALLIGLNTVGIDLTAFTRLQRRDRCRAGFRPAEDRLELCQRHHPAAGALDQSRAM